MSETLPSKKRGKRPLLIVVLLVLSAVFCVFWIHALIRHGDRLLVSNTPIFPADADGDVLRRMFKGGDDLTKPRIVDFNFIFYERHQAIAFADIIPDQECEVCISYYKERRMWQTIVSRSMVPTYANITMQITALSAKAKSFNGEPDGWGCMQVSRKE